MGLRADGTSWAIATPHTAATDAGAEAFERGGTAMDAALHAAATLAVAYPHMCGVGGDLFALVQRADGEVLAINSSGRSPVAADPSALDGLREVPIRGPVPITVPGAVAGWSALHRTGAVLPWADAFGAATRLAADGVPVSRSLEGELAEDAELFASDPGLASIYFVGGDPAAIGDVVRQPALARTLEAIASGGPEVLYGGAVGDAYVAGLRAAGSPITIDDLAAHRATILAALRSPFQDLHVSVVPPNSQGFALLQMLALLDRLEIDPDLDGPQAARIAHVIEVVNADRDRHLADADRMLVHPSALLEDGHLAGLAGDAADAAAHAHADGDTIALVTADAQGNAVSLIQSLFWGFGSGICEPSTGIVAQNRGACFTLAEGHPNRFAPGVRPFHTLMPVLVHDADGLAGVPGTMGGYHQPQINLHTITKTFVGGAHPADAVAAPRWVVLGAEDGDDTATVGIEEGVPEPARRSLRASGDFGVTEADSFGHAHMIRRAGGRLLAGSDPRADGSAAAD
ncbi:MAG: gamma-glutamyltransferase family protein [Actinomycetota bacterium]